MASRGGFGLHRNILRSGLASKSTLFRIRVDTSQWLGMNKSASCIISPTSHAWEGSSSNHRAETLLKLSRERHPGFGMFYTGARTSPRWQQHLNKSTCFVCICLVLYYVGLYHTRSCASSSSHATRTKSTTIQYLSFIKQNNDPYLPPVQLGKKQRPITPFLPQVL